jgi:hypothetical protein
MPGQEPPEVAAQQVGAAEGEARAKNNGLDIGVQHDGHQGILIAGNHVDRVRERIRRAALRSHGVLERLGFFGLNGIHHQDLKAWPLRRLGLVNNFLVRELSARHRSCFPGRGEREVGQTAQKLERGLGFAVVD